MIGVGEWSGSEAKVASRLKRRWGCSERGCEARETRDGWDGEKEDGLFQTGQRRTSRVGALAGTQGQRRDRHYHPRVKIKYRHVTLLGGSLVDLALHSPHASTVVLATQDQHSPSWRMSNTMWTVSSLNDRNGRR